MGLTNIEWCDYTFNPWRGCAKVSAGCANCYAESMSKRNPSILGTWGNDGVRVIASAESWNKPFKWNAEASRCGQRKKVFCASMADVFEDRPELDEPLALLLYTIHSTPNLDWLLLSKRPELVMKRLHDVSAIKGPSPFHADGAELAHWFTHLREAARRTAPDKRRIRGYNLKRQERQIQNHDRREEDRVDYILDAERRQGRRPRRMAGGFTHQGVSSLVCRMNDAKENGRQKCQKKRHRGNVYLSEEAAERAAASMSLRTGANIRAFRCLFGEHWHIGRDRSPRARELRGKNETETRRQQQRLEEHWDEGHEDES